MANINAVLNDQIRRIARRETKAYTQTIKRATGHYRSAIAALKRQVAQLNKLVAKLAKQVPQSAPVASTQAVSNARLRIDGLKAHRARLGLSAKDYGRLMGVSALTVYNWEAGKSKPRRSQLPHIVAVRGIGKRQAMQRLGMTAQEPAAQTSMALPAKRGKFPQTGAQFIVALLAKRPLSTAQVNQAWIKHGRSGSANVLLGHLVNAKKIKRTKLKGQRGSTYHGK